MTLRYLFLLRWLIPVLIKTKVFKNVFRTFNPTHKVCTLIFFKGIKVQFISFSPQMLIFRPEVEFQTVYTVFAVQCNLREICSSKAINN
jgi:hypothetical protein